MPFKKRPLHDQLGAKWRDFGDRHRYLKAAAKLVGSSAVAGGVFIALQTAATKIAQEDPNVTYAEAHDRLLQEMELIKGQLQLETGKNTMAAEVLAKAVKTGEVPTAVVDHLKNPPHRHSLKKSTQYHQ